MEVIAISGDARMRVVLFGDKYILQSKISCINYWNDKEETEQEWMASKWILDNELRVGTEYPTIAEIREQQKND
jgi:hypothetical protein